MYDKDLDFSYGPFLPILGTGLVTANGALWQKQRLLMAPALRVDMLDAIIPIAKNATDRLTKRLQQYKNTAAPVDMFEEIRLLTLQIIGEAILSLAPDECDRVSQGGPRPLPGLAAMGCCIAGSPTMLEGT